MQNDVQNDVQPDPRQMIIAEEHARGDAALPLSYDTRGSVFGHREAVFGHPLHAELDDSAVDAIVGVLPPAFSGTTAAAQVLILHRAVNELAAGTLRIQRGANGWLEAGMTLREGNR